MIEIPEPPKQRHISGIALIVVIFALGVFFITGYQIAWQNLKFDYQEYCRAEIEQQEFLKLFDLKHNYEYSVELLENVTAKYKEPTCICNPEYDIQGCDNTKIHNLLKSAADMRDYELHVWDCSDMCESQLQILHDNGWSKARLRYTNVDCDLWSYDVDYTKEDCLSTYGSHVVIDMAGNDKLFWECTAGDFVHPDDYEKYGLK